MVFLFVGGGQFVGKAIDNLEIILRVEDLFKIELIMNVGQVFGDFIEVT